jgi:hypothetical protein
MSSNVQPPKAANFSANSTPGNPNLGGRTFTGSNLNFPNSMSKHTIVETKFSEFVSILGKFVKYASIYILIFSTLITKFQFLL